MARAASPGPPDLPRGALVETDRRLDRILGTTAGKVVNHADRNVLVVRNAL